MKRLVLFGVASFLVLTSCSNDAKLGTSPSETREFVTSNTYPDSHVKNSILVGYNSGSGPGSHSRVGFIPNCKLESLFRNLQKILAKLAAI